MSTVVLNMRNLTDAEIIQRAKELQAGMTGNANFPDPDPTTAAYGTLITTAETKMTDATAKQEAAKLATLAKDEAIAAVVTASTLWADYVQTESKGDEIKIRSTNLGVKAASTPIGHLTQVLNLSLTIGDNPGEVDAQWNAVRGRSNYEIQLCTGDPAVAANWQMIKSSGPSKTTLTNLASGTRVWIRVRAKAPKDVNDGPWSDPATIIVP